MVMASETSFNRQQTQIPVYKEGRGTSRYREAVRKEDEGY
jgi:hypothetical protein